MFSFDLAIFYPLINAYSSASLIFAGETSPPSRAASNNPYKLFITGFSWLEKFAPRIPKGLSGSLDNIRKDVSEAYDEQLF